MELSAFHYDLPDGLIAQYPLDRGTERLMIVDRQAGEIRHCTFADFEDQLNADDLLLMNDTRVMPARLHGRKMSGGKVEIFLLKLLGDGCWRTLIKASKSPKPGTEVHFDLGLVATVMGRETDSFIVRFNDNDLLPAVAQIPLPPYIERSPEELDLEKYQTVYAANEGSVAAPTAGLHFTPEIIDSIRRRGVETGFLTLHVGAGTFKPVRCDKITEHNMHSEDFFVSRQVADSINAALAEQRRIVTVGTTTTRVLEHLMLEHGEAVAGSGSTDIFIYPGKEFRATGALLTNFHLPCSTLLMLVCALGGYKLVMKAYSEAVKEQYRFFSYGDAMLII